MKSSLSLILTLLFLVRAPDSRAAPFTPLMVTRIVHSSGIQTVKFFKPDELGVTGDGSFESRALNASSRLEVREPVASSGGKCSMFYTSPTGYFLSAAHCLNPCLDQLRSQFPLRRVSRNIQVRDYPVDILARLKSCSLRVHGRSVELVALGSIGDIVITADDFNFPEDQKVLYYSLIRKGYSDGGDVALFRDISRPAGACVPVSFEPLRKGERMLVVGFPSRTHWENGYNGDGSSQRIAVAYPSCGLEQNSDLQQFLDKNSQSLVSQIGRKLYPTERSREILKSVIGLADGLPTHQAITEQLVPGNSGGGVFSSDRNAAVGVASFVANLYGRFGSYVTAVHENRGGSYFLRMEQIRRVLEPKLSPREFRDAFDCPASESNGPARK